jgi:orotate phosphoribosyltransferase
MTGDDALQHDLLEKLEYREGHFVFESGHHGDRWLDLDRLFLRPRRLIPHVAALAERLSRHGVDMVCGPMVGGALVAREIATELDVEFCYTERFAHTGDDGFVPVAYRIPASLQRSVEGKRMAVVDDAINAGSAVSGTLVALRACGAVPVALGALLVLARTGRARPAFDELPLERIAELDSRLWTPAECPLCASGVPLERQ